MARTDSEQLVFSIEARIANMEKQMAKASKVASRTYGELTSGSSRAARSMDRNLAGAASRIERSMEGLRNKSVNVLKDLAIGFSGGLVGGLLSGGLAELPRVFAEVTKGLADLNAEAKRAGLDVEEFQALEYAASKSKVSIDALTDGIKELQLRADEFVVTGKGSGAEAFQRLGFTAEQLKAKLKKTPELLLEIVDRVRDLDKAAQIRVFDELFGGTGGEQFVQMIGNGAEGIRTLMNEARAAGYVLDREIVEKAADIDQKFSDIATNISSNFKRAVVVAAEAIGDLADQVRDVNELAAKGFSSPNLALGAEAGKIGAAANTGRGDLQDGGAAAAKDLLRKRLQQGWDPGFFYRDDVTRKPIAPTSGRSGGGSGGPRGASATEADREAKAVRSLIEQLHEELALIDASDLQRETAIALRRAGAAATGDQKKEIVSLVAAIHNQNEALQEARDSARELSDTSRDFLGSMISDLRQGKSGVEALQGAFGRLLDRMVNSSLDAIFNPLAGGKSGGGNIFGSILTGIGHLFGFDRGGFTGPGGKYEPAGIVHRGEYVFSKDAVDRIGVGNLNAIHGAARSYADGGAVSQVAMPRSATIMPRSAPGSVTVNQGDIIVQGNADEKVLRVVRRMLDDQSQKIAYQQANQWRE